MKKVFACVLAAALLCGCAAQKSAPADPVEVETTVPAVTEIPETQESRNSEIFSQEMAMIEGYVVMQDGDVRHNAGSWFAFLEGKTGSVTVMQYTQTDAGTDCVRYDVAFDGTDYKVTFEKDGQTVTEVSQVIAMDSGPCEETQEPFDSYVEYTLNDFVLYRDLIAEPDFEGVKDIFLHAKESQPPVKAYRSIEEIDPILQLLMTAEYLPVEPETYMYGMKLLMTNRDGMELEIELDLNRGIYRYGMQTYGYGNVEDMLDALGLEDWPESVKEEFGAFIG